MVPVSLPYTKVGNFLLKEFPIEPSHLQIVNRDIACKAYLIPKRGSCPIFEAQHEELLVPVIEMGSSLVAKDEELKKFADTKDRMKSRGENSLDRLFDSEVFKLLNAAVNSEHQIDTETLTPESFKTAFGMLQEHDLPLGYITISPRRYWEMVDWPAFKKASQKDIAAWIKSLPKEVISDVDLDRSTKELNEIPIKAFYHEIPILVSAGVPKNAIFVTSHNYLVGVYGRSENEISGMDDRSRRRDGVQIISNVGFAVVNDYAVVKILVYKAKNNEKINELPTSNVFEALQYMLNKLDRPEDKDILLEMMNDFRRKAQQF